MLYASKAATYRERELVLAHERAHLERLSQAYLAGAPGAVAEFVQRDPQILLNLEAAQAAAEVKVQELCTSRRRDPMAVLPDEICAIIVDVAFPTVLDLLVACLKLRGVAKSWHRVFKSRPVGLRLRTHAYRALEEHRVCVCRPLLRLAPPAGTHVVDRGLAVSADGAARCPDSFYHTVDAGDLLVGVDPKGRGAAVLTAAEDGSYVVRVYSAKSTVRVTRTWGMKASRTLGVAYYAPAHNKEDPGHKAVAALEKGRGLPPNPHRVGDTRGQVAVITTAGLTTFVPTGGIRRHQRLGHLQPRSPPTSMVTCPRFTAFVADGSLTVVFRDGTVKEGAHRYMCYLCYQPERGLFCTDNNGAVWVVVEDDECMSFRKLSTPTCNRLFGLRNGGVVGALVYAGKIERAFVF